MPTAVGALRQRGIAIGSMLEIATADPALVSNN